MLPPIDPDLEIVLDLSRLLSRARNAAPTGIDRVEMAYARTLLEAVPDQLEFAAVHPAGIYGRLQRDRALRFLDIVETRWDAGTADVADGGIGVLLPWLTPRLRAGKRRIYVLASHNNLVRPRLISGILKREHARLLCLVHDLIPIEYPEYARAPSSAEHRVRIETVASQADMIVANSTATLDALHPWLDRSGRSPATAVALLGTHSYAAHLAARSPERPYFVCVGTIEPRKNHLLLLNIWRRLSEARGAAAVPRLLIIGRRGWENEQIVDMLERCPSLRGCVEECGGLSDRDTGALLAGARALLLPSFAEGYGMPVAEALQLGTPVICSDLPALHEAGGGVPDYLDPLDGIAWMSAIAEYCDAASSRAAAQRARLADWTAPSWRAHIAIVLKMMHSVAA